MGVILVLLFIIGSYAMVSGILFQLQLSRAEASGKKLMSFEKGSLIFKSTLWPVTLPFFIGSYLVERKTKPTIKPEK